MSITRFFSLGLTLLIVFSGCGKKGELRYPEFYSPAKVDDFRVKRDGAEVVLSWTSPKQTASGNVLKDLSLYYVKRAPFALRPHEYDFDTIAEVTVDTDREIREGPLSYEYRDKTIGSNDDYQYMIVPVNADGVEGEKRIATVQSLSAPTKITPPPTAPASESSPTPVPTRKGMEQHND